MYSGRGGAGGGAEMSSQRVAEMLEQLKSEYDQILQDSTMYKAQRDDYERKRECPHFPARLHSFCEFHCVRAREGPLTPHDIHIVCQLALESAAVCRISKHFHRMNL